MKLDHHRSLARRVALASAMAAAFGGAVAALASGIVSTSLIAEHDQGAQLDAVSKLAEETLEELEDDDPGPTLAAALAHGLDDLELPGARGAIYVRGALVAGDARLPAIAAGRCDVLETARLRVCAIDRGERTFVLALGTARTDRERVLVAWSVLVGVLVGALAAGVVSGRVAAFSLAPIDALRERVRGVDPLTPEATALEPPMAHTEVEELRLALRELIGRLAVALDHARQFASQAAHELRTPLATLSAELELLAEASVPDPAAVARLLRDTTSLTSLVERLLVLATPTHLQAAGEPVDLGDVVQDALERVPSDSRPRLRTSVEDDAIVRGDAALLRSVVTNAVDNALKFSEDEVRVVVSTRDRNVFLEVIDGGPGIAAGDRERVFAAFFRSAEARSSGKAGHGIGLALIEHVISMHGGNVEILDSIRGLHLRFTLPSWSSRRD